MKKKDSIHIVRFPGQEVLFGSLIKQKRSAAKITQGEFAEMMHVTRNTIINWEANKSKPDYNYIPEICALLGIRLHELFNMEPENGLSDLEGRVVNNIRLLSPTSRKVIDKMISTMADEECLAKDKAMKENYDLFLVRPGKVAAGTGAFTPEEPPTYTFLRKNTINAQADGIVQVIGKSMEPVYHDGDFVYYEKTSSADPGEDVVVDTDDGAVIKRMSEELTLYSVNSDPAYAYPKKNDQNSLIIRGRVLGTVHSSDRPLKDDIGILEELFVDEIRKFNEENGIE